MAFSPETYVLLKKEIEEGGGGGSSYDLVVKAYHSDSSADDWEFSIEAGSYTAVDDKLSAGTEAPNVLVKYRTDYLGKYGCFPAVVFYY